MTETVMQFGAGNFLRGFLDTFLDEMNRAGQNAGRVFVVQSTGDERARRLNAQGGAFHLLVRGVENGATVDRVQHIKSISRAVVASEAWGEVLAVAVSPDLRAIVSNTTEAGMALDPADTAPPAPHSAPQSFPAKLLCVLYARWQSGAGGLMVIPCELLADNADRLRELVAAQAQAWGWTDPAFAAYLDQSCVWVNTLVDRIVSGKPAVAPPGLENDTLLTVAEPYTFWAVESKPGTEWLQHPAIHRVADVGPFSLRKVRILNGAHTALVAYVRRHRPDLLLVREAVADPQIAAWLRGLLFEEIVPVIENRCPDAVAFAHQTLDRFANPFLDHKLSDIALHHDKKVPVRLVSTRDEYRLRFGADPPRLTEAIVAG